MKISKQANKIKTKAIGKKKYTNQKEIHNKEMSEIESEIS